MEDILLVILFLLVSLTIIGLGVYLLWKLVKGFFSKIKSLFNRNNHESNSNSMGENFTTENVISKEEVITSANNTINSIDEMLRYYCVDHLKVISRNTDNTTEYVLTGINRALNMDFSWRFSIEISDFDKEKSNLKILFKNQTGKNSTISLEILPFEHPIEGFVVLDKPTKEFKNGQYEYVFATSKLVKIRNGKEYFLYSLGNGYPKNVYCVKNDFWRKEQILYWLTKTDEFSTTGMIALVNEDGTIDVIADESITLYGNEKICCKVLPIGNRLPEYIKFGTVEGNFYYTNTGWNSVKHKESGYKGGLIEPHTITTLEGCPDVVTEMFRCEDIGLTSLIGGPKKVGGDYIAKKNSITTLEGVALEIGGDFDISKNELTDEAWEYAMENIPSEIGGNLIKKGNKLIKYMKN